MAAIRSRSADARARRAAPAALAALLFACGPAGASRPSLVDAPVAWEDSDREDIARPRTREPNLAGDAVRETFARPMGRLFDPGTLVRRLGVPFGGDHVRAASDVNALDEALNSSWFTNRIGLHAMTPAEAARGPGPGTGPSRAAPWTVVGAKTEGVTPGFTVEDADGARFLVKFDPPGGLGSCSGAGAISARILHAAGYFVPDDVVVTFRREDLLVGPGARIAGEDGEKRPMTEADLDRILEAVEPGADGSWLAISSRYLPGKPAGPFDYQGRRGDDPNDRVRHENRRELRGLRIFAAWLNHFDTKQHNTLDTWVEEEGRHYLRHHLIDFASTLGAGANGAAPRFGREYTADLPATLGRIASLGLREDGWRRLERPSGLPEIGYFETEGFSSFDFDPFLPNSAFAALTDRDGYWAAKIVSAFTDEHLRTIVETARYPHPEAAEFMWRALAARRDRIAREWFDRVPPLDHFSFDGETLRWRDLGVERGVYASAGTAYAARVAWVDAERSAAGWSRPIPLAVTELRLGAEAMRAAPGDADPGRRPFLAVRLAVDRGEGAGPAVTCYVARASGRVVAVDR